MVTLKFARRFPASMISHADVLKTMNRILRRAGVEVEFSQGFNPHMLLFFSPPLPLGVESESEYVCIAAQNEPNFLERFNAACPQGFHGLELFEVPKNPNLAHIVNWADFQIVSDGIGKLDLKKVLDSQEFFITHRNKGAEEQKNVRSFIGELTAENDNCIRALLKFGNINLRADRFADGVRRFFGQPEQSAKICKLRVFDKDMKKIDELLRG